MELNEFISELDSENCLSKLEAEPAKTRIVEKPWEMWSENQKSEMMKYINYCTDQIAYINRCWQHGPSKDAFPIAPEVDIVKMLKKESKRKSVKNKRLSEKVAAKKLILKSPSVMDDVEFNNYLQAKLCSDGVDSDKMEREMNTDDIEAMGIFLKDKMLEIEKSNETNLKAHIDLGGYLNIAKSRFDHEKRANKIKLTWAKWIEENANISDRYSRQHREMAKLAGNYPKLKQLALCYTEFAKLKSKIQKVFCENFEIAQWWKK